MRLRTNKRLAERAEKHCTRPIGYDFKKSKWLDIKVLSYRDEPWESPLDKGKMNPPFFRVNPFFRIARAEWREVNRCIKKTQLWFRMRRSFLAGRFNDEAGRPTEDSHGHQEGG